MGRFDQAEKPPAVAAPIAGYRDKKPNKPSPKPEPEYEPEGPINVDEVDRGAHALLRAVNKEGTLADRTKAFVAVTGWLELRSKIQPTAKGPTKFDKLRANIGRAHQRGGDAAEGEEAPEAGGDDD